MIGWFRNDVEAAEETLVPRGASRTYPQQTEAHTEKRREITLDSDAWWKPFWTLSALLIFVGVLWSVSSHVWAWLDKPITEVAITGKVRHLDKVALANTVAENLQGRLLTLNIEEVQSIVSEQPWVRVAGISREWPAALTVDVEEEVPVARWGEKGLLNHQGDIFWPELKSEYKSLPRLSGPAPDTERVMSQFHDLNQMFRAAGLRIVSLNLEARGAWSLELDNNITVVVGREAINERLQRFLELYQHQLAARVDEIEQVDIRYTHGVAVKWREKPNDENAG